MVFKTVDEAEKYFQENFTESDDVDKEEARFERWLENQEVEELADEFNNDPRNASSEEMHR